MGKQKNKQQKKHHSFRLERTQLYFSAIHQNSIGAPGSKSLAGIRLAYNIVSVPEAVAIIHSGLTSPLS